MSAIVSHTGWAHEPIKRLIKEGEAKQSKMKSTMKWLSKCISMVTAKTGSRNAAFKAGKMSEAAFETQATFFTLDTSHYTLLILLYTYVYLRL